MVESAYDSGDLGLNLNLSGNSGTNGLLDMQVDLVLSTIYTSVTDHIMAARKWNSNIFRYSPLAQF